MKNECLICGEPLEYLNEDVETECEICHKKENSKTRCVKGHYVCSECHMKGPGGDSRQMYVHAILPYAWP